MPNITAEDWVLDPNNIAKGLYLVAIGPLRVPVKNQSCPRCKRGWSKCKFAVYKNQVYHKACLAKWKGKKFAKLVASGEIDTE